MTVINVMLTFPFVLLALAVIAVLGPSLVNMIIVLGRGRLADLRAGGAGRDPGHRESAISWWPAARSA